MSEPVLPMRSSAAAVQAADGVDRLAEGARKAARSLLEVLRLGPPGSAAEEAFRRFVDVGFSNPEWVAESAVFLTRAFADHEGWLARQLGIQELIQEMSCGQAALTCVIAGEWVMARDAVKLGRLAEGMLAARMQLRQPDCLDLMLGVALSLALVKPSRAQSLLAHVEECRRAGVAVDEELLDEVKRRLQMVEVIGAADQATRQMWDERLSQPHREWSWHKPSELKALRELAEWLVPEHPAAAAFAKVVPPAWWELWLSQKGTKAEVADVQQVLPLKPIVATKAGGAIESALPVNDDIDQSSAAELAGVEDESLQHHLESRLRLGWFTAGGVLGALVAVILQMMESGFQNDTLIEGAKETSAKIEAASGGAEEGEPNYADNEAGEWCRRERARLVEELEPVTRLGAVASGKWADHSIFLTGQTPELPVASGMFRKVLTLLHLEPPRDPETRMNIPRLLLRRAQDEEVIVLWERCIEAETGLSAEIAAAAAESLDQPSMPWTEQQRQRLAKLANR